MRHLSLEEFTKRGETFLPGFLGIQFLVVEKGRVEAQMEIRHEFLAPNGFLHAASIVALADTACGYGAFADLPRGAKGFTTIELKSNFLGTALQGTLHCVATRAHSGRSTQVWDAVVVHKDTGRKICLFRATQIMLYPESPEVKDKLGIE